VFERFNRWISGDFDCIKCGKRMHLMSFGYGETICPNCYDGEKQFIFLDKGYWLNRLLSTYIGQETLVQEQDDFDEILLEQMSHPPIIREAS
jgi:hypothetical protein